ncbi:hypothetical protein MRB53_007129 [Persea americana]|uniref:Uncharacterized protein n=1 Tax=Persea americana TaxID=3435 RepID=A0ACC2MJ07_PERAE|nr:hypothetical protein MRB53_007129 [Persea americana]
MELELVHSDLCGPIDPPSNGGKRTPEEAWSGRRPSIDHLRILGCIAYAHVPDEKRKKLDDKGVKCVFLGVSAESKAYRLYNPVTKQIIISHDVVFYEENVWDWNDEEKPQIPVNCDNEEQQQLQIPVFSNPSTSASIREHTPKACSPPVQRHRKRPAWMMDYLGEGGKMLIVCLYVDDLIYTSNDKAMFDVFKQSMMTEFDMTDLGLMHYFLSIEVVQGSAGNFLYQKKEGVIDMIWCSSEDQVADILTKPLKLALFVKLHRLLGVCSIEDSI